MSSDYGHTQAVAADPIGGRFHARRRLSAAITPAPKLAGTQGPASAPADVRRALACATRSRHDPRAPGRAARRVRLSILFLDPGWRVEAKVDLRAGVVCDQSS